MDPSRSFGQALSRRPHYADQRAERASDNNIGLEQSVMHADDLSGRASMNTVGGDKTRLPHVPAGRQFTGKLPRTVMQPASLGAAGSWSVLVRTNPADCPRGAESTNRAHLVSGRDLKLAGHEWVTHRRRAAVCLRRSASRRRRLPPPGPRFGRGCSRACRHDRWRCLHSQLADSAGSAVEVRDAEAVQT